MDRFVKLTVVGKLGNETERIFNLRFVRAVDAEKRTVLLEGNKKPFVVTEESAKRLVEVLDDHRAEIAEREFWRKLRGEVFLSLNDKFGIDQALSQAKYVINILKEQENDG